MKPSKIGGQAVIEGIMMRNNDVYAVAVRKPNGEIELKREKKKLLTEKYKFLNFPIIRGIFNFGDSLVMGVKTLTYSASFFEEEEVKDTKVDEVGKNIFKDRFESILMAVTILCSVALAIGLFMVLPYFISRLLSNVIVSKTVLNLVEGVIRIIIFVIYMYLISLMEDIKRVYMYHGAEHKCINCIENGLELNVANVRKSSKQHKRCGTSFMLLVMFVSVIFFIFIHMDNPALQVLVRILLVPVIAGVSYEVIRFAGKHDNVFVKIISAPGMLMQRLSTKEPDDDMIEVAIRAVEAVFDWRTFLANYDREEDDAVASKPVKAKKPQMNSEAAKPKKAAESVKTRKQEEPKPVIMEEELDKIISEVNEVKATKESVAQSERQLKEVVRESCIAKMEKELTEANYNKMPDALEDLEDEQIMAQEASVFAQQEDGFVMDIPVFKKRDKK